MFVENVYPPLAYCPYPTLEECAEQGYGAVPVPASISTLTSWWSGLSLAGKVGLVGGGLALAVGAYCVFGKKSGYAKNRSQGLEDTLEEDDTDAEHEVRLRVDEAPEWVEELDWERLSEKDRRAIHKEFPEWVPAWAVPEKELSAEERDEIKDKKWTALSKMERERSFQLLRQRLRRGVGRRLKVGQLIRPRFRHRDGEKYQIVAKDGNRWVVAQVKRVRRPMPRKKGKAKRRYKSPVFATMPERGTMAYTKAQVFKDFYVY